jgi:hypothetical protein
VPAGANEALADSTGKSDGEPFTETHVEAARSTIETIMKSYVGQRLFGTAMRIRIQNTANPLVREGLQSWPQAMSKADQYPVK